MSDQISQDPLSEGIGILQGVRKELRQMVVSQYAGGLRDEAILNQFQAIEERLAATHMFALEQLEEERAQPKM